MSGGYGDRRVWRPAAGLSLVYSRRGVLVTGLLLIAGLVIACITMVTGQYALSPSGVWQALFGEVDPIDQLVVLGLRLPRVLTALLVGASLGVAGGIFQSIARNPLASPDIIGFTTGSATGALAVILIAGESGLSIGLGAVLGGFATAILIALITLERGIVGHRMIVVGIAIGAMLGAVNDYLLTRAELERAQVARTWLFGSLHATTWNTATLVTIGCTVLIPPALALAHRLRMIELGDDLAAAMGLSVVRSKIMLLSVAVALTAVAIVGAGPIGFVALAAPQLARRLARTSGVGLLSSAAMGGLLVVAADLAAQRILAPLQIPVGLLTGALGGAYLVWLLALQWRASEGGVTKSRT